MTTSRPMNIIAFALMTLVTAFAATARTEQPTSAQSAHGQVRHADPDAWAPPTNAARKTNPLTASPELTAGGRKLFRQRCAECHGDDATGTSRAPDLTRRVVQSQSDGALFWRISGGNSYTGMPSFSYLPELQRWQLILHLRTLQTTPTAASAQAPRRP